MLARFVLLLLLLLLLLCHDLLVFTQNQREFNTNRSLASWERLARGEHNRGRLGLGKVPNCEHLFDQSSTAPARKVLSLRSARACLSLNISGRFDAVVKHTMRESNDIRSLAQGMLGNIQQKEVIKGDNGPNPTAQTETNKQNRSSSPEHPKGTDLDEPAVSVPSPVSTALLGGLAGPDGHNGLCQARPHDDSPEVPRPDHPNIPINTTTGNSTAVATASAVAAPDMNKTGGAIAPVRPPRTPRRQSDVFMRRSSQVLLAEELAGLANNDEDDDSVNVKSILDDINKPKTDVESAKDILAVMQSFDEVRETLSQSNACDNEEGSFMSSHTNPASEIISLSSRRGSISSRIMMKRVPSARSLTKQGGAGGPKDSSVPKGPSIPLSVRPPVMVNIPKKKEGIKATGTAVDQDDIGTGQHVLNDDDDPNADLDNIDDDDVLDPDILFASDLGHRPLADSHHNLHPPKLSTQPQIQPGQDRLQNKTESEGRTQPADNVLSRPRGGDDAKKGAREIPSSSSPPTAPRVGRPPAPLPPLVAPRLTNDRAHKNLRGEDTRGPTDTKVPANHSHNLGMGHLVHTPNKTTPVRREIQTGRESSPARPLRRGSTSLMPAWDADETYTGLSSSVAALVTSTPTRPTRVRDRNGLRSTKSQGSLPDELESDDELGQSGSTSPLLVRSAQGANSSRHWGDALPHREYTVTVVGKRITRLTNRSALVATSSISK